MARLRDALLDNPTEPYLLYNYGLTAYLAGNLTVARDAWERLKNLEGEDRQVGRDLGSLSLFQLGNADIREGTAIMEARNFSDALILFRRAADFYRISEALGGKGSNKAEQNLEKAEGAVVKASLRLGRDKLRSAERRLSEAQERIERGDWRNMDRAESDVREAAEHYREALALQEDNEDAQEGLEKAQELLGDALLAEARAHRKDLEDHASEKGFRNTEHKVESYERVIGKYDEALAANEANEEAQEERNEVASEIAQDLLAEAEQHRNQAREFSENGSQRKLIEELDEAQEKLVDAHSFDPEDEIIADTLEKNELWLAEFKEERGDDLVANAERNQNRPDSQIRNLESAREEYEEAAMLDPRRAEGIEEKLDALEQSLAEAFENSGDQFTGEAMEMAEAAAGGEAASGEEAGDFDAMGQDDLQVAISKMERGIKDYEMAQNLDPGLQSAADARAQALQQLAGLRDTLNQKRIDSEGAQMAQAESMSGDENIQDSDMQAQFDELRDLQVTRSIFRSRNYDTERQDVARDW